MYASAHPVVSRIPDQRVRGNTTENIIILLMLGCHATQLLTFFAGGTGAWVGMLGALMAIVLSLFSEKAMFLLLFGLNFLPLTNPLLAGLRIYVLVYFVLLARLCITPTVFAVLQARGRASTMLRRWYIVWGLFAAMVAFFFFMTAKTPYGVSCAWDMVRGLGTAFLACILAIVAIKKIQGERIWSFVLVSYTWLGALWWKSAFGAMGGDLTERLGFGGGSGDPNALGLILNVGIGICIGVIVRSRSWWLRLYAVAAGIMAARIAFMTGSRAALLTTIIMVLAAAFVNAPRISALFKRVFIIGCLVIAGISLIFPFAQDTLAPRVERTIDAIQSGDMQVATSGRNEIFYSYWRRAMDNLFLGCGFDYESLADYHGITVAHNTWLQIFSDFGIEGFVLFLALMWPVFRLVLRGVRSSIATRTSEDRPLAALGTGVILAVIGLLVTTNTLTSTFEIIFWWCMGCAVGLEYRYLSLRSEAASRRAVSSRDARQRRSGG